MSSVARVSAEVSAKVQAFAEHFNFVSELFLQFCAANPGTASLDPGASGTSQVASRPRHAPRITKGRKSSGCSHMTLRLAYVNGTGLCWRGSCWSMFAREVNGCTGVSTLSTARVPCKAMNNECGTPCMGAL